MTSGNKIGPDFFARSAEEVAKDLVGCVCLVRRKKGDLRFTIIEVTGHEGGNNWESRQGMFYEPGKIFMMFFRRRYMLNVATDSGEKASCVCIRAIRVESTDPEQPPELVEGPMRVVGRLHWDATYDINLLTDFMEIYRPSETAFSVLDTLSERDKQGNVVAHYRLE